MELTHVLTALAIGGQLVLALVIVILVWAKRRCQSEGPPAPPPRDPNHHPYPSIMPELIDAFHSPSETQP